MSYENYNIDLINLQDKSLQIESLSKVTIDNKDFIEIKVCKKKEQSNTCCLFCHSENIKPHAYYNRKIKYLPIAGLNSYLLYKQRRFICNDCGKTFNESNDIVVKNSTISNQTKTAILHECCKKQSAIDIAERTNVSHTTINNELMQNILNERTPLSPALCIDEFKASTMAGKYALIIGDPVSGNIIDILPSRRQDYIYYYFQQIPDSERFLVKYLITDLFESYRTVAKHLFWKSTHIADRFHWIRLASLAISNQRIRTMKHYKKVGELSKDQKYIYFYEITKRYHRLLIANTHTKESWYFDQKVYVSQLKKEMSFQEIIEYIVNFDKDLEEGYHLLQDLYKFAKYTLHGEAEKKLLEWCEKVNESEYNIIELKQVTLTYKSWKKEIGNSFIFNPLTKTRLTNGFIEGKNNFVKVIKRVGFGY